MCNLNDDKLHNLNHKNCIVHTVCDRENKIKNNT